jgi:hypothetical protein
MDKPSPSRTPWLVLAGIALLAAAVATWSAVQSGKSPHARPDPFPLPTISKSPFRNTSPEARYLGSEACRSCHEREFDSFRATAMGRSMALVDSHREPPDGDFEHPASKRRYEVRRRDGQVWHRELLLAEGPEEVLLAEFPLKYVVGSGHHSLTYLVEDDGFLMESPVTWFTSRQAWRMSPGYDDPKQPGFQRGIGSDCLFCHAGQSAAKDKSMHRMAVQETAISCERCHGPGSLHVDRHSSSGSKTEGNDDTIVNPAHLSRDLAESICQQCHLRTTAVVPARGRTLADFRPGLPLEEFQYAYLPDGPVSSMKVTGHVEQMHASRCFQQSDKLTCVTCHDPHHEPPPAERTTHYNTACLACHAAEQCKVDDERRRRESPENHCVQCHMPQTPTEITHLAFTHHRIGLHASAPSEDRPETEVKLRSFYDLSQVSELDRTRSLGLAYLQAAEAASDEALSKRYRDQAFELVSSAYDAGLPDALLDVALARLYFDRHDVSAMGYAETALADPKLTGLDRCNALSVLANVLIKQGRTSQAADTLRQLVEARRQPADWLLLAQCEQLLGHPDAAEQAMMKAVQINPRLHGVHQQFAEFYRRLGNRERAQWHEQRAAP